jgi:hypothetical protein
VPGKGHITLVENKFYRTNISIRNELAGYEIGNWRAYIVRLNCSDFFQEAVYNKCVKPTAPPRQPCQERLRSSVND